MTKASDPIEPTQVYDSTPTSTSRRIKAAASWVRANSETAVKSVEGRTRGLRASGRRLGGQLGTRAADAAKPGGAVDRTEERIHGAVQALTTSFDGRAHRAANFITTNVHRGASLTKRVLRGSRKD